MLTSARTSRWKQLVLLWYNDALKFVVLASPHDSVLYRLGIFKMVRIQGAPVSTIDMIQRYLPLFISWVDLQAGIIWHASARLWGDEFGLEADARRLSRRLLSIITADGHWRELHRISGLLLYGDGFWMTDGIGGLLLVFEDVVNQLKCLFAPGFA